MDDLRALYRRARELGLLMMPYVNPTWWCDQSLALKEHPDAVLAIGLDGKPYREWYGPNGGWSICALHPLVRELDDRCLRDFVDDLGCDILFQDQIGARGFLYDLNPAEPTPYAYTEGMIALARTDCQKVPLSTERGWDGILNYEAQFCGVAWAAVPTTHGSFWSGNFWENFAAGQWRISPLPLYMAHDKVAFTLHDLGHFVYGEPELAMVLALGHQLSYPLAVGSTETSPGFRWFRWLDVLQKQVAARYMLAPLEDFGHLTQSAVRAQYGDITVAGSIEERPVEFGDVVLASPGWYARSADGALEAGRLARYRGRGYPSPIEFVRVREGDTERWWLYGSDALLLPADGATSAARLDAAGETPLAAVEEDGRRYFRASPSPMGQAPPAELATRPPADWPQAPKYIGLINMTPGGPGPGWADAGPERWRDALANSAVLGRQLLEVRQLTDPEDILHACARPREWFAILNPYGELFPVPSPDRAGEMLDAVASYVSNGGIWWETGGFSFYYPCWPVYENGRIVRWERGPGISGLARLLGQPAMLPDNCPAEPVALTDSGRALLGEEASRQLASATACVNRPMPGEYGAWTLVSGPTGPYVAGYQIGGWGYLFRVGGPGQMAITLPCVEATIAHLLRTPPREYPTAQPAHVWQVVLRR